MAYKQPKKRYHKFQLDLIIDHIEKNGSISQREAYIDHGIQNLSARLAELKYDYGYVIRREAKAHPVTGQEYSRYYIDGKDDV